MTTAAPATPLPTPSAPTIDANTLVVLLGAPDHQPTADIITFDPGPAHIIRTPAASLDRDTVESIAATVQSFNVHTIILPSLNSSRALDTLRRSFRIPPAVNIRIQEPLTPLEDPQLVINRAPDAFIG